MAAPATPADHAYLVDYGTVTLGAVADLAVQELRHPHLGWNVPPVTLRAVRVTARDILHTRALEEYTERALAQPLTAEFLLTARALKPGYVVLHAGATPRDPSQPTRPRVVIAVAHHLNETAVTYTDGDTISYGPAVPMDVRTPLGTPTP
jgi:hypothetical protein